MADIDSIIAGVGGGTRADFSNLFSGGLDSFYKGRDQKYQQEGRDLFKGGVPTTADGQPDFAAMGKALFQHGDFGSGAAASNLDLQRQQLQQNRDSGVFIATGQAPGASPAQPIVGPSTSRNSVTIDPSKRADSNAPAAGQPQQQPAQSGQPATVMTVLAAQGIPNDQLGAASASLGRQLGVGPTDPININDPQVRNVLVPAVQQLKRMGIGQAVPQGQPAPQLVSAQQPSPPQPAPAPQQQNPFANAQAAGLIPPNIDPVRYFAGLKYRAAALPAGPAQKAAQSQVDAITKATELTATQRDFNASAANPKIDDYVAGQEGAKASAKGVAEADVKEQTGIIDAGHSAQSRLTTLNTVANIVQSDKNLTLGFGADTALKLKKALQQLGMDVGDLSGAQAIQKLNGQLASEAAKSVSPRPAQFEFKTFLNNNPGLSLDKAGNLRVLGIFSQLAKRDVDLGRLARQNRDNWQNWDNVVEKYDKQNPVRDPVTHTVLSTDSVIAPGTGTTAASANGGFSKGQTAVNPKTGERVMFDGSKWAPLI